MNWTSFGARFAAVVFLAGVLLPPSLSALEIGSGPVQPIQWPDSPQASPKIEAWPNALRLFGEDRYQTNLATALTLRGRGGYPFGSPDSSSGGAGNLESANGWWGLGVCPTAIVVVAGDVAADALSAASLSDPTTNAREPYLERTASSDPLFYPVGGFTRVNTDYAPVIVTASARSGATDLGIPARIAITDLRTGICNAARQAVIIGGLSAVPKQVEKTLLSIGYSEVFRIGGVNRFDTAAQVAWSLGTSGLEPNVDGCVDSDVADGKARMGWYENSVIEWRSSAQRCELLERSVVLTDGVTGADALAAGWWTSFWQVPILLHDGSDELPESTVSALQTLSIDNVIVLGGLSRISQSVANKAEVLASANVRRVAGEDRYETSVKMAEIMGGWWPTSRGNEYASSMVCIAASSGSGRSARGWPDALGAGTWCGAMNGAAVNPGAPKRMLYPITGRYPRSTDIPSRPLHDAVPVILVRAGARSLPISVARFLNNVFEPGDIWCSSVRNFERCTTPGFAIIFGGAEVIPDVVVGAVSASVSGSSTGAFLPGNPVLLDPFVTALPMGPVFAGNGTTGISFCVDRGRYQGARWIVEGESPSPVVSTEVDVVELGYYHRDPDGVPRSPGVGSPLCLALDPSSTLNPWIRAVSPTGRASAIATINVDLSRRLWISQAFGRSGPSASSGEDLTVHDAVAKSSLTFVRSGNTGQAIMMGAAANIATATVTLDLKRTGEDPPEFTAVWAIETSQGTVNGSAEGSALFEEGVWYLRGRSVTNGGTWTRTSGSGGFSVDIAVNGPGFADDSAVWSIDSFGLS